MPWDVKASCSNYSISVNASNSNRKSAVRFVKAIFSDFPSGAAPMFTVQAAAPFHLLPLPTTNYRHRRQWLQQQRRCHRFGSFTFGLLLPMVGAVLRRFEFYHYAFRSQQSIQLMVVPLSFPASTNSYSKWNQCDGCTSSADVVVMLTVNPVPVITVNNATICAGNSFTLNAAGALTYTYSSIKLL